MADTSPSAAQLFSVAGMVAVVTGGGTGIGLMITKALASNGASKVYILGRRLSVLREAASSVPTGNVIPIACDVTSKDSLGAASSRIQSETGFINLLVANSGITGPLVTGLPPNPTLKQFKDYAWNWSTEEFANVYAVNNTAPFFTTIAFLELLDAGNKKANLGSVQSQVIITSSIASYLRAVVTGFAYVTSKAAAVHLTKALATYLAPYGIRSNGIAPGLFPSDMTTAMLEKVAVSEPGERPQRFAKTFIPAERTGLESDMMGTLLYMTSKAGAYLNGNIVVLDGGRLSVLPATY